MSPSLLIEATTQFVISAGGSMMTAMVVNGSTVMPSNAAILFSVLVGLVGAANHLRGVMKMPPSQS